MTWEDSNFKGNECGRHSSVKQNGETMCQEKYMSMISVINWLYPLSELQKRNWRSINCSVVQLSTMLGMQKGIHCWVIAITRHKWKIIIPRRKTMNLSKGFVQQELGHKDWGYLEYPHSQSASSAKINICNDRALALLGTGRKHLTMREQKKNPRKSDLAYILWLQQSWIHKSPTGNETSPSPCHMQMQKARRGKVWASYLLG